MSQQPIALVTGASRGIGAATAKLLAQRGYVVCVNYLHNESAANTIVSDIESSGGKAFKIQADVSKEADIVGLFDVIDQQSGPLSVLVNNAGVLKTQMPVVQMTAERINEVLQTNVTGPMICCREAIKRMSTDFGGRGGSIVNLSSAAARLGSPNEYVDYAASKGAIDTLTIGLAKEVAEQGIRVNAVRPGIIDTDIHASGGEPDRIARLKSSIPMQRAGTAEEVANAIVWLISDEAAYVTGSCIDVAGGR